MGELAVDNIFDFDRCDRAVDLVLTTQFEQAEPWSDVHVIREFSHRGRIVAAELNDNAGGYEMENLSREMRNVELHRLKARSVRLGHGAAPPEKIALVRVCCCRTLCEA